MMEQQIALNNEEYQDMWKQSIRVVCCVHRVFDYVANLYEVLKEIVDILTDAFHNIWNSTVDIFKACIPEFEKECEHTKTQKKRPHRFYNEHYKVNTFGFKPPIKQCARSRC